MNLKKLESYLRVNLLGPGPRLVEKRIYRAAVLQRLRNNALDAAKWKASWAGRPAVLYAEEGIKIGVTHESCMSSQSRSGICGEEKIPSIYRESNLGQPFAILSELPRPQAT